MEKRLVIAVILMMAVVFFVNILFPPAPPPESPLGEAEPADGIDIPTLAPEPEIPETPIAETELAPPTQLREATIAPADTIWVTTPLYRLGFSTRGAGLVSAELSEYESLAPETKGALVQLIEPGSQGFLTHAWIVRDDTLDLANATFVASAPSLTLSPNSRGGERSLTFTYQHPEAAFRFEVRYTFRSNSYVFGLDGRTSGVPATGWWLLGLGPGLESNEWDPEADYRDYLAFVAKGLESPQRVRLKDTEFGERRTLNGPFDWVAVHTRYFVTALLLPPEASDDGRFAGLRLTGLPQQFRAQAVASFPVGRDGSFAYNLYIGPMDPRALAAAGRDLNQVAPYGYKWLQPIIRPLAGAIISLLVWSKRTLNLSYGWILILFGIGIRVVLFPLYQKSMRSQMSTMRAQPLMKEIQAKYKHDPQKLQQEMIKLYREQKINPLGGCLPMLLPFPILIALFFVFKDTIEFRGVPFLWLPDLSRADPLYIIPVLMGLSLFVLTWIGQRGMPQDNPQAKVIMYVMPVMMVVLFLNFASGLNLYYATMNLASLPQQLFLAKERRAARGAPPEPAKAKT